MRINKPVKIIIITVCVLVITIISANVIIKNAIEKRLAASLNQFKPYIEAGFSNAHVNLFAASIQLDSLYILYNPELKQQHVHEINFPHILISGISFFNLVAHKNFNAGLVEINNGRVCLDEYLLAKNDTLQNSIFKNVQMPFKSIFFNAFQMKNITILQKNKNKTTTVCTAGVLLSKLQLPHIDTAFNKDSIRFSDIVCDVNSLNYRLNNYYSAKIKTIHISAKDSVMGADSFRIVPLADKFALGQKSGKQEDYINASVNAIKIEGLNVAQLLQKKLSAKKIDITKTIVYVFRDRRLTRSKEKQPMPLDYLKKIPLEVNVDELNLNNATVTSEEFPKEGGNSGYIKLENLSVTMKPFLNHSTATNNSVTSYIKASLMGAGNIQATINLSLQTGISHIKGSISNLQLTAMNPSAENLGRFHIQSGVLNLLNFEFAATNTKAEGYIVGEYHNLVIDRLKLTKDGFKKANLPSFLLHKIIIPKNKDASLDANKRTGKIDYERDPSRFVTFYYLKALLDGIRDSFTFGFVLPS